MHTCKVESFTHGRIFEVIVAKEFLTSEDKVLIIDDFLANGSALMGLTSIVKSAGAELCGAGEVDLSADAIIWDVRQREMLLHAKVALTGAATSIEAGGPIDAVCTLAEEALAALRETDGRGVEEEIVSEIFKRFCVGK